MLRMKFLLLCCLLVPHNSMCFFDTAVKIGKLAWKVSGKFGQTKTNIDGTKSFASGLYFWDDPEHLEVLREIAEVSTQLQGMEGSIGQRLDVITNLVKELPYEISIAAEKRNLRSCMETIDDAYNALCQHIKHKNITSPSVWKLFARDSISAVRTNLQNMRIGLVAATPLAQLDLGLIMRVANRTAALGDNICKDSQSLHHFVAQILQLVILRELKAVMILSVAYSIEFSPVDSAVLIADAQRAMEKRYMTYLHTGLDAMRMTPESIRRCDPESGGWIRGESYVEIERLDQVLLTPFFVNDKCEKLTSEILQRGQFRKFKIHQACDDGILAACRPSGNMNACPVMNDVKRYKWAELRKLFRGKVAVYGPDQSRCENTVYGVTCICDCRKEEENTISLAWVATETHNNMVVTGARIIRQNKTLWIQLKQGKLLPNAQIDPTSQSWIPIHDNQDSPKMFITMSSKRFFLNNFILPHGYALTGVQFVSHGSSGVSVKISGQKFDPMNGTLLPVITFLELDADTVAHNHYKELKFAKQNSIYTDAENVPDSDIHWIELQRSQFEHDVGQSMLPLFDSQAVETNPPSPLGGIGLFHKGVKNYAGFIALELHSLPYKEAIEELIAGHVSGTMFGMTNLDVV